jgi:hypothetical protein
MDGHKHLNVDDAVLRDQYASFGQLQDAAGHLLSNVSGADTITADSSPAIPAYAAGQIFWFVAAGANTGAVTLNIEGLGAKAVTKNGTTALVSGDISSGSIVCVIYDGTQFQLVGPAKPIPATQAVNSYVNFTGVATHTTAGTSPTFTVTVDSTPRFPAFSLTAGMRFRIVFHTNGANPGDPNTLNINGSGAVALRAQRADITTPPSVSYNALIVAGYPYDIQYDGSDFIVLNPVERHATNSYPGVSRFATTLEIIAGAIAAANISPAGFASLIQKTPNGYITLPGGTLIQWGVYAVDTNVPPGGRSDTFTFPIAFPNGPWLVLGQLYGNGSNNRALISVNEEALSTTTQCTFRTNEISAQAQDNWGYFLIAIGD